MDIATIAEQLISPRTGARLAAVGEELVDSTGDRFPVRAGIPRFVADWYADSFGDQGNRYRRVQLDSATGKRLGADRFSEGRRGPREELAGSRVLAVG